VSQAAPQEPTAPLPGIMNVDRLVHSPARLAILTCLYVVEEGDAVFRLNQTGLSWGNLSTSIAKLEEAGYVEVVKEFKDRKPHTLLRLTSSGRQAFEGYLATMRGLLDLKPVR